MTAEECKLAVAGESIPAKVVVAAAPAAANTKPMRVAKKAPSSTAAPNSKPLPKPKVSLTREGVTPSNALGNEGGKGAGAEAPSSASTTTTHRIWPFGTLIIKRKDSSSSSSRAGGGGGGGSAPIESSPKDPKEIEAEIQRLQAALVTAQKEVSRESSEEGKGGEKQRV